MKPGRKYLLSIKQLPPEMATTSYTALLEISRQMLEMAKQQNWDALALAQEKRAALIAGMKTRATLSPAEIGVLAPTIKKIQDFDREILEYVAPWRDDVAKLLARLSPSP